MQRRRAIGIGIATVGLLTYALVVIVPLCPFVREAIDPSLISWDGHSAYARCPSAIAGRTSWPDTPDAACEAMHMCANEATMSDTQATLLDQAIRATPGCEPP